MTGIGIGLTSEDMGRLASCVGCMSDLLARNAKTRDDLDEVLELKKLHTKLVVAIGRASVLADGDE